MNPSQQVEEALKALNEQLSFFKDREIISFTVHNTVSLKTCTFNPDLPVQDYNRFFDKNGWQLPDDYQTFLKFCNGAVFFTSKAFGGGVRLLSIEEIERIHSDYSYPAKWCPIAWSDHIAGAICINTEAYVEKTGPYLLFIDAMSHPNDAIYLNYDFATWFTRLIVTQGSEFWLWDYNDSITFKYER